MFSLRPTPPWLLMKIVDFPVSSIFPSKIVLMIRGREYMAGGNIVSKPPINEYFDDSIYTNPVDICLKKAKRLISRNEFKEGRFFQKWWKISNRKVIQYRRMDNSCGGAVFISDSDHIIRVDEFVDLFEEATEGRWYLDYSLDILYFETESDAVLASGVLG